MMLPDSSVWLSLALSKHVHHGAAREWLEGLGGAESAVFCRFTQITLLRLLSTAAVLAPYGNRPLRHSEAWSVYEQFLSDERIGFAEEPAGTGRLWFELAARETASPKLWMDAYLAAFAMAGGLTLVTTDRALRQHDRLDLVLLGENPKGGGKRLSRS